jgi:hypothetical protein
MWAGKFFASLVMFSAVWFTACNNNDDPQPAVLIEFLNDAKTISEAANALTPEVEVTLKLNKAATKNGSVKISASPAAASVWATFHTTVAIEAGQTFAKFKVVPINNAIVDGDRTITFTLSDPTSGFTLGQQTSMNVYIIDDEEAAKANFDISNSSTAESNEAGEEVVINISAPTPGEGNLSITLASDNAEYGTHFTTVPAAVNNVILLPVSQSLTNVSFTVIPVDNADLNAARVISFTITNFSSDAVIAGTSIPTHTFTINDDEIPSEATFTAASSSLDEDNTDGINIAITLDPQTTGTGTVSVSITSDNATYGTHYTTDPAATGGTLTVNAANGVSGISFKVIPVNNNDNNESLVINLSLTSATGIVVVGASNTTHQLTIVDDEIDPVKLTIADIRALYSGSPVTLQTGGYIEATVTSSADNITSNNVFVQDETAGIVLRFTTANSTLALGDVIKVEVGSENTGVQLNAFQGLYQMEGLTYDLVEETGTGATVTPQVITVAQANTGNYQGKVVTFNNVYLKEANGTKTYGGNTTISDGTNEIVTFVRNSGSPQALFKDDVVPQGIGTVTGIMTTFGAGATPQLLLRNTGDVDVDLVGTLTLGGSINDFGSVDNGNTSASQQFTVSGSGLVYNVNVSAPTNFEVSTNNTDFSSSVELSFAIVNAGPVTVYIRFAPTSGVDGSKDGTVSITSIGAEKKTIDVVGTESGNAASYETLALWTFEVSVPAATDQSVISNIEAEIGVKASTSFASGVHASSATDYSNPVGNGSNESFSVNTWEQNDYFQFELNSTGYSDIKISWDQTGSSTGPSDFALYYSVDGTNFTKHADYVIIKSTGTNIVYEDATTGSGWLSNKRATNTSYSYDLNSINSLDNSNIVIFRLVHTGTGIAAGGTNRVDNFKVEAIQN